MFLSIKRSRGVSLIELLVVLVISSIIIVGIYRTFIRQQKTYNVQEQVVDLQKNARLAIAQIMRDIRLAGFGNVSMAMTPTSGPYGFTSILNPNVPKAGALTIVLATAGSATLLDIAGPKIIAVDGASDSQGNPLFDSGYVSIGGVETHAIKALGMHNEKPVITLKDNENILNFHPTPPDYLAITKVYGIRTITYRHDPGDPTNPLDDTIKRNEIPGTGEEILADNIESLQFRYYTSGTDETGTDAPENPKAIERIQVTVTARTWDPEFGDGGGYRRRQIKSYIKVRNPLTP